MQKKRDEMKELYGEDYEMNEIEKEVESIEQKSLNLKNEMKKLII